MTTTDVYRKVRLPTSFAQTSTSLQYSCNASLVRAERSQAEQAIVTCSCNTLKIVVVCHRVQRSCLLQLVSRQEATGSSMHGVPVDKLLHKNAIQEPPPPTPSRFKENDTSSRPYPRELDTALVQLRHGSPTRKGRRAHKHHPMHACHLIRYRKLRHPTRPPRRRSPHTKYMRFRMCSLGMCMRAARASLPLLVDGALCLPLRPKSSLMLSRSSSTRPRSATR